MENLFITRHGHWGSDTKPDNNEFVCIGMDRTSTGKSWKYVWAKKKGITPSELAKFITDNVKFWGGVTTFEIVSNTIAIWTSTPGTWIGSGGRWVKGMQEALKFGRVSVKSLININGKTKTPFPPTWDDYGQTLKFRFQDTDWNQYGLVGKFDVISTANNHNYMFTRWSFEPGRGIEEIQEEYKAWIEKIEKEKEDRREKCKIFQKQVEALGFYVDNAHAVRLEKWEWVLDLSIRMQGKMVDKKPTIYVSNYEEKITIQYGWYTSKDSLPKFLPPYEIVEGGWGWAVKYEESK